MAADVLLRCRRLAAEARGRRLLAGFELALASGEIVALRGRSGAGKSTLLRSIALLQDPAEGRLELRGQEPAAVGWVAWRRQVCLVPQLPAVFPGPVRANLARPFAYRGAAATFDADRARRLLDAVRLEEVALAAPADRLSVGQQQRLCTVRALLLAPTVLLLDEPTSALDPATATAVEDGVRAEIDRRGAAALVVSHDPDRAARWCDRVIDLTPLLDQKAAPGGVA
jgi:ABC-type iron transport system FetAB ATPase subunit